MGSVRRSNWKRYLPFLVLNVVVSVCATLSVLAVWSRVTAPPRPTPTATESLAAAITELAPTATATLQPSPTPRMHVVQPGDSLYAIAQAYDVPVDLLMILNGLVDPNALSVGQELIIPSEEAVRRFLESATTPQPVSGPATTPTVTIEPPKVEIVGIDGTPGDLESEAVRLLNSGGAAAMLGWRLEDGEGNVYIFPAFTLYKGAVSVHTRAGEDTVIDLYWGLEEAVWYPGKVATLRDASGRVLSTFTIP